MGHVQDLWYTTVTDARTGVRRREKTRLHGKGQRYRARYIDPDGRERSKSFPDRQKRQAELFLASVEHDIHSGGYLDPRAGQLTFRQYADRWLASQTFDQTSRETVESRLRAQTYPQLGQRRLAAILPTDIREWQRGLQEAGLAPNYRRSIFVHTQAIFDSAVDDGKIRVNPCKARSVRRPHASTNRVVPWSWEQVSAVRDQLSERLRLAATLAAGLGLRYGEVTALALEDIDFEGERVIVRRAIKTIRGGQFFGAPKGGKSREVPLPESVAEAIRSHLERYPPAEVRLPWLNHSGQQVSARLLLHNRYHRALQGRAFVKSWSCAVRRALGRSPGRGEGFHSLRHFYASTLLDRGESIVAVAAYLGHADAGFTLRTYTHLMPTSHHRTRETIDAILGPVVSPDDSLTS